MTRDREGDVSRKWRVIRIRDVLILPDGIIKTKPQGKLIAPRWNYRDNPINGLGEKEDRTHFSEWENKPPDIYDD